MASRNHKVQFVTSYNKKVVYGYFHSEYKGEMPFPVGVIKICCKFVTNEQCWKLEGDVLKQFLTTKNTQLVRSPTWIHDYDHNIKFSFIFWPNGRYTNDKSKGFVCWLLQISFDGNVISKVKATYHLYCKQFNDKKYEYIDEERLFGHTSDTYGIHHSVMKLR